MKKTHFVLKEYIKKVWKYPGFGEKLSKIFKLSV